MSSKPKQTAGQKELERSAIEREKQLRVERARETTRAFSENVAFRKKLRGIYSLLSGGFAGFPMPLGSGGGRVLEAGSGGQWSRHQHWQCWRWQRCCTDSTNSSSWATR